MTPRPTLVVFSHLRWDFVYQRPQHLMSRLAARRPVLFIEEPSHAPDGLPRWEFTEPAPGVTVCRPFTAVAGGGFTDPQMAALAPMVRRLIADRAGAAYDIWFYTPLALPLADGLAPRAVAYDCMDELSAFRFAPPELLRREAELLRRADVVFTGGPSLYRAKKDRHPNAHCFSSSVDAAHFARAADGTAAEPPEQAGLPRPRLGFFGVIDERFDAPLLAAAADARPGYQFVMVGPVVKIDPADLPKRPNVHYFGQQPYEKLPGFLSGWDVALMPFARNESTRFISPTKTLEYMAAGKPIVSTPITDVAEPYGTMVGLGGTAGEFVAACDRALSETPADRGRRLATYRGVLSRTSWDATAGAMAQMLEAAARVKGGHGLTPETKADLLLPAARPGPAAPAVVGASRPG